jgi:hypothetical protein
MNSARGSSRLRSWGGTDPSVPGTPKHPGGGLSRLVRTSEIQIGGTIYAGRPLLGEALIKRIR